VQLPTLYSKCSGVEMRRLRVTARMRRQVLKFLPDAPAAVKWLSEPEKKWLQNTLAQEAAVIGEPPSHNVFAAFRNPRVLMLGVIAFLMLGATTSFTLSGRFS
jgi:hypothetical protein